MKVELLEHVCIVTREPGDKRQQEEEEYQLYLQLRSKYEGANP